MGPPELLIDGCILAGLSYYDHTARSDRAPALYTHLLFPTLSYSLSALNCL